MPLWFPSWGPVSRSPLFVLELAVGHVGHAVVAGSRRTIAGDAGLLGCAHCRRAASLKTAHLELMFAAVYRVAFLEVWAAAGLCSCLVYFV
ncbi:MAG: hypothetical protein ACJ788_03190 [Ktedonobacteraceae bacterium]